MLLHFHFVMLAIKHGNANHKECKTKVSIKSLIMVQFKKLNVLQKA